ncbi:LOW QUALITY PROTEIN: IucA/IucC, partial [Streptomyces himastatinicus ATCC 53653]
ANDLLALFRGVVRRPGLARHGAGLRRPRDRPHPAQLSAARGVGPGTPDRRGRRRRAAAAAAPQRGAAAGGAAPYVADRRAPVHRTGQRTARRQLGGGLLARSGRAHPARTPAAHGRPQRRVPGTGRLQPRGHDGRPPGAREGHGEPCPRRVSGLRTVPVLRPPLPPHPQGPHRKPRLLVAVRARGRGPLPAAPPRGAPGVRTGGDRVRRGAGAAGPPAAGPRRVPAPARPPLAVRHAPRAPGAAGGARPRRHPRPVARRTGLRADRLGPHALLRPVTSSSFIPERAHHQLPPQNADYELSGAVALTRLLEPVAADLAARFPGADLLREPGYRTLDLDDRHLSEGFGVIVREGLDVRLRPGLTGLLAAAVADEYPTSGAQLSHLLGGTGPEHALAWWQAYLDLLVPPVLAAWFDHGVVLEPHLQNVVIGVDNATGTPRQVLFRDLEGTKLVSGHHDAALAALPEAVARPMTYERERGWDRVVYCLLVNHLAEMVAALADRHPRLEPDLWSAVRRVLCQRSAAHDDPPALRALVAGVPLPAKANLLTRWGRKADRDAGYVRIVSPLASDLLSEAARVIAPGSVR